MIDGGVWSLPSIINGSVFANQHSPCLISNFASSPQSGLLAGTIILIDQMVTTAGGHTHLYASLLVLTMGTSLDHQLQLFVDGVEVAHNSVPCCAPPSGPGPQTGTVSYEGTLTPGSHEFTLKYFIVSTGLSTDRVGAGGLTIEDCP